ncbi:glucose-6-phosphate dehydrogenase assembly protein OpcA [Patulibacter sp. SYSU D01012]|uniref:glucose-6-phosphate dehydrogenase assembly protein OpcA n=1 Tax=Patulibacter sp. SYSU D01012 TaxID=2817381 RepID=UPI001B30B547
MSTAIEHTVWQQDDVDPAAVEGAMRALERERFQRAGGGALPARALNLVAIVDAAYAGEISRRLESIGRNTPSRTVLVRVSPRRATLSARVTLTGDPDPGSRQALSELVELDVAERHLLWLESIVDPMVMTDVPTIVWAPHGHTDALESIGELAQTVMLDTADAAEVAGGFEDAWDLLERRRIAVVDLSWLRATPWRQRLAAHYAGGSRAGELHEIVAVEVRHERRSAAAAWLMLGWLGDRLGWRCEGGTVRDAAGLPITLRLTPVDDTPPGLAGTTVSSRSGSSFALDRNPGGLRARRMDVVRGTGDATTTTERHWTVMGASRGEAGVLGTALRRTLVPDDGYHGALATARRLHSCI